MNKEYLKSYLYSYETRIVETITEGVINRASKASIMRSVRDHIDDLKFLNRLEKNELWDFASQFYRHTVAGAARKTDPQKRADAVYAVLRKDTPVMEHVKNDLVNNIEYRKKHKDLVLMLRDEGNKFFYCTVLKDAAADHAGYQGKFYYNDQGDFNDEEREYIKEVGMLSVENVTLDKPYLTTRRNCRHRLVPVSFSEVQKGYSESEKSFHEISYEEEQYRFYRDRYKMMAKIKKVFEKTDTIPSQLKVDMKRTRNLILSWYRASKKRK